MESPLNLLSLPDLALYHICSYLDCPIDLLNVSSTCTRLRKAVSSQSFWWRAALNWCEGMWPWLEKPPALNSPQQWIIGVLQKHASLSHNTKSLCTFGDEKWERVDDRKFRCHLGMLRIAYADRNRSDHPAILYQQWLYDIGLYHRSNPSLSFSLDDFKFNSEAISMLASLGQAKERDLRARKQPHINPVYYIQKVAVAHADWQDMLFPSGPHGTIAPLLICPFQDAGCSELSGLYGLRMCLSLVLEKHLKPFCLTNQVTPAEMWTIINRASESFLKQFVMFIPQMKERYGLHCMRPGLSELAKMDSTSLQSWQSDLDELKVPFHWKSLVQELHHYVERYKGIDNVVDKVRLRWRHAIVKMADHVLGGGSDKDKTVVRINLTDSDLIGGDNKRQEMSATAFISDCGVLVTWHLTGRIRF